MNKKGLYAAAILTVVMMAAASPVVYAAGEENVSAGSVVKEENKDALTDQQQESENEEPFVYPETFAMTNPDGSAMTNPDGSPVTVYGCFGKKNDSWKLYLPGNVPDNFEPALDSLTFIDRDKPVLREKSDKPSVTTWKKDNSEITNENSESSIYPNIDKLENIKIDKENVGDFSIIACLGNKNCINGNLIDAEASSIENSTLLTFQAESEIQEENLPGYLYLQNSDHTVYFAGILLEQVSDENSEAPYSYWAYTTDEWGFTADEWKERIVSNYNSDESEKGNDSSSLMEKINSENNNTSLNTIVDEPDSPKANPLKLPLILVSVLAVMQFLGIALLFIRNGIQKKPEESEAVINRTEPKCFSFQHIGKRPQQQDSFGFTSIGNRGVLAVLADGMGGLKDSDQVSRMLVQSFMQEGTQIIPSMPPQKALRTLLMRALYKVNQMMGTNGRFQSGSTFLAVWAEKDYFNFISVGDSHIYLIHQGSMYQVNREHIYASELNLKTVNGEMSFADAEAVPKKGGLTSFVGMGPLRYIDESLKPITFKQNDTILLMSDGVFNTVHEAEILSIVESAASTEEACGILRERVLEKDNPKQDNFTCIMISHEQLSQ